jgi:hypothetical protein
MKMISTILKYSSLFLSVSFFSCQKETVTNPQTVQTVDENSESTTSTDAATTTTILTLKPGPGGQDTYVTYWNGDPSWANSNGDFAQELSMQAWTNQGLPMGVRSYIRFPGLIQVPAGAVIVSANLVLSAKGSSISNPNGNSGYPGSPYSTDNSCTVERVTGKQWKESTLTWNTQPAVTTVDAAIIPASNSQWGYNVSVNVTNMVKATLSDLSKNYGFRIRLTNENIYRSMIFASSENSNPALRPKLVIRYKW